MKAHIFITSVFGMLICVGCSSSDEVRPNDARQASYSEPAERPMTASDRIGDQMTSPGETYVTPPQPDAVHGYNDDFYDARSGRNRGSSVGLEPHDH